MAITNYNSPEFYVGKNSEGEFFSRRCAEPQRDFYRFIHTPKVTEAEAFCEHNAGFLVENGYELVPISYNPITKVIQAIKSESISCYLWKYDPESRKWVHD